MAVIRWFDRPQFAWPGRAVEQLQREMNRLLSEFPARSASVLRSGVFPAVNISEDKENLYVRAELPGMKPEELEISVEGESLTIRGERKLAEAAGKVDYHRREREAGGFRRVIDLSVRIDTEAVSASFRNGVLKIVLPKAKEVAPKQISIKTE